MRSKTEYSKTTTQWRGHIVDAVDALSGDVKTGTYYADYAKISYEHWLELYRAGVMTLPMFEMILDISGLKKYLIESERAMPADAYERCKESEVFEKKWMDLMSVKTKDPARFYAAAAAMMSGTIKTVEE
jgi:hypothetical protein